MMPPHPYRHKAFISYSHSADARFAPALQLALERFAKRWYRRRAISIFRDETNLSVSPELWPVLEEALSLSEYFILLASPAAAASKWVDREVRYWLDQRSIDSLVLVVTDGELAWDDAQEDFAVSSTSALPRISASATMVSGRLSLPEPVTKQSSARRRCQRRTSLPRLAQGSEAPANS